MNLLIPDQEQSKAEKVLIPEVVEPEIVGLPSRPKRAWRTILAQWLLTIGLAILGLGLCVVGGFLTLTIIGAAIGIPLLLIGLALLVMVFFLFLSGSSHRVTRFQINRF